MMSDGFDVIVLGAGAAGMMCAAVAGRRGRRVLLVEHAAKLGEKSCISGGGRRNFTNLQDVERWPHRDDMRLRYVDRMKLARGAVEIIRAADRRFHAPQTHCDTGALCGIQNKSSCTGCRTGAGLQR